jgi:hypothetical protein
MLNASKINFTGSRGKPANNGNGPPASTLGEALDEKLIYNK